MEADCIINFVGNISEDSSDSEDCPKVVVEGLEDQPLTLLSLSDSWNVIFIVGLFCCVTMNFLGKIFIMWFIKYQSIDRPLNALILIDQGVQLLPVLVEGIGTTSSLILKRPLVNFVGGTGCRIWFYFTVIHQLSLTIFGAGMAAYRLAINILAHRISDCKFIRKITLLTEAILFIAMFTNLSLASSLNSTFPPFDFCEGHTSMARKVINQYGDDPNSLALTKQMVEIHLALNQCVILIEVICYLLLYYRKKTDSLSSSPVVTQNMNKRRNRQNTITLTGQIISFAIETAFTVVLIMVRTTTWLQGYMPIFVNVMWFSITVTQIITSSDMRRFLLYQY